jgi:hypothetical protein
VCGKKEISLKPNEEELKLKQRSQSTWGLATSIRVIYAKAHAIHAERKKASATVSPRSSQIKPAAIFQASEPCAAGDRADAFARF